VLLTAIYSRVGYKQRMSSWVSLVAATAAHPERELRAVTVGRAGGGDDVRTAEATITDGTAEGRAAIATGELERLVALFDLGMREPLPLFCRTSAAYAAAARSGQDPVAEAGREWASGFMKRGGWFSREDEEPEHQLVLGGVVAFDDLLLIAPGPDESGDGWAMEEPSRLGRLARHLWDGLLHHEQVSSR
jgi:exodeoxyribonuclease V gamma subunit